MKARRRVYQYLDVELCDRCKGHTAVMYRSQLTFAADKPQPAEAMGPGTGLPVNFNGLLCLNCAQVLHRCATRPRNRRRSKKEVETQ